VRTGSIACRFGLIVCLAAFGGCTWFGSPESRPVSAPAVEEKPFHISATPAFRLIVDQREGDLPSRLLVLWARIETSNHNVYDVRPIDARVVLPDGNKIRVLDRERAAVLVRRTWLGAWDLSYQTQREFPWGGLYEPVRKRLQDEVIAGLLDDAALTQNRVLEGYLVVDTVTPLASLERVGLEIVARRASDRVRVRNTYQFASSAAEPAAKRP